MNKHYNNPYAPWCWNIYQHLPEQNHPSFVGKYTSTMVRIWVIVGATTMHHENLSMNIMAIQLYTTSEALPIGEAVV